MVEQPIQESLRGGQLRAQAEALTQIGFKVIPLYGLGDGRRARSKREQYPAPGKHPVRSQWQKRTLDSPKQVRRFRWRTDHNLGIL